MTTERPYRATMTPEQALDTIVLNGGVLFDPQVVKAFREAWDANLIQSWLEIR
jgi:HD-GYP domain-containing protein (c-di-GMP phosphodiesterase class II)